MGRWEWDSDGAGKLKVKSCGKDGSPVTWAVQRTGGNWATVSGGKGPYGTASFVGSCVLIGSFTFDQGSQGAFDPFLATLATSSCETIATTQPSTATHFDLKLNARDMRAYLRGPWQAAP
jgi:hypothetical protein